MRLMMALALLVLFAAPVGGQTESTQVTMVSAPTRRFTTHWVFLVDTSYSTHKVFNKVKAGFFEALNSKIDELYFSVITFNNEYDQDEWPGNGEERPFTEANLEEADQWINDHCGILSYGAKALEMAIRRNTANLTVILISDGGFTEATGRHGFGAILNAIDTSQQWRINRGLNPAVLCCIGVENKAYGWPKQPDEICQGVLKGIGERWGGGYFLATSALD